jgi:hypothetical protein
MVSVKGEAGRRREVVGVGKEKKNKLLGSGGMGKKTQLHQGPVLRLGGVSSHPKDLYTGFFGWCAGSLRPISCPCRSKDSSFSFTKTRSLRKVFFFENFSIILIII